MYFWKRNMENTNRRTLADYLRLSLNGFVMGAADVVPGVSGGTMAFILGIYDELIDSIRSAVPFLRQLLRLRFREAFAGSPGASCWRSGSASWWPSSAWRILCTGPSKPIPP
jgi:hypothetical protein